MNIILNRRITIERKTTTQDAVYGTPIVTWVPLVTEVGSPAVAAKFWAEVQDVLPSRSEAVRQGLEVGRNQSRVRMRWRDDIDQSMRMTLHGDSDVIYQIVAGPAEIKGRKNYIEFMVERFSS